MKKGAPRVAVEGTCAAGHVTSTTAERGRTTWQGECSSPDCQLPVNCRRVPSTRPAAPDVDLAGTTATGTPVRRVRRYADDGPGFAAPAHSPDELRTGAGGDPAGLPPGSGDELGAEPIVDTPGGPGAGDEPEPEPLAPDPPAPGARQGAGAARRRRAAAPVDLFPGIFR